MIVFAAVLILIIRLLAVRLGLGGVVIPETQWRGVAWFTARGVASLYCLAFAINHGLSAPYARQLAGVTLVVVVCSLIASAISGLPLSRPEPGIVHVRRPSHASFARRTHTPPLRPPATTGPTRRGVC